MHGPVAGDTATHAMRACMHAWYIFWIYLRSCALRIDGVILDGRTGRHCWPLAGLSSYSRQAAGMQSNGYPKPRRKLEYWTTRRALRTEYRMNREKGKAVQVKHYFVRSNL